MSECAWQRLGIWLISANPDLMKPDWAEILAKEWDYWAWSLGKHLTWGMTRQTKRTIVQMCTHATLHTHIYTDIVRMFCKITPTTIALQHRLDAFKEVMSGMVSWDGACRGKERPISVCACGTARLSRITVLVNIRWRLSWLKHDIWRTSLISELYPCPEKLSLWAFHPARASSTYVDFRQEFVGPEYI